MRQCEIGGKKGSFARAIRIIMQKRQRGLTHSKTWPRKLSRKLSGLAEVETFANARSVLDCASPLAL